MIEQMKHIRVKTTRLSEIEREHAWITKLPKGVEE